ncbi:hypothetical protein EKH55_4218 [Sinorhizobium alkalisoli]|nr:hypothetical protein EKH55_4218 [Sinorhizobium alkalisoli]
MSNNFFQAYHSAAFRRLECVAIQENNVLAMWLKILGILLQGFFRTPAQSSIFIRQKEIHPTAKYLCKEEIVVQKMKCEILRPSSCQSRGRT